MKWNWLIIQCAIFWLEYFNHGFIFEIGYYEIRSELRLRFIFNHLKGAETCIWLYDMIVPA